MRRLWIAIAALLASVASSAGELDGKALICKRSTDSSTQTYLTYWEFKDGTAIGAQIIRQGSKAVALEFGETITSKRYVTGPTEAMWWGGRYLLNRATLALEFWDVEYQCELATSLDSFRATLEAERLEKQKVIDERMADNKI
jgi:hypothetical protein